MFIPRYDLIKDPTQQQRVYVNQVIREVGEAFPQDYIYRQQSAHEMWTNLAAKNQNVNLQASVADVYTAIVENQSQELSDKIAKITDADAEILQNLFNELRESKQNDSN